MSENEKNHQSFVCKQDIASTLFIANDINRVYDVLQIIQMKRDKIWYFVDVAQDMLWRKQIVTELLIVQWFHGIVTILIAFNTYNASCLSRAWISWQGVIWKQGQTSSAIYIVNSVKDFIIYL